MNKSLNYSKYIKKVRNKTIIGLKSICAKGFGSPI